MQKPTNRDGHTLPSGFNENRRARKLSANYPLHPARIILNLPQMVLPSKFLGLDALKDWRRSPRSAGTRLVVTNGCFDLLHAGHVAYLQAARALGDLLLVGLNGDVGVRALKGPKRPVNSEIDRAVVLAALACVDCVTIFPESTALRFLSLAEPDIYVKGADYTLETLNQEERRAVESAGGRIVFIPFVPGKSTTEILRRLSQGLI